MNHIYKSIFNKALGVFTAVPEFASAHGKGSERTVVGRVAKGTAGFAASALAISVGLALTSTNAVAAGAPGIYVNNSNDPACMAFIDDINVAPAQIIYGGSKRVILPDGFTPGTALSPDTAFNLAGRNPCVAVGGTAAENHDTQTNRTLFYNDKNLTLGGRLDVNSGIIGVGDRGVNGLDATNSIRMGMGTALSDDNKKTDAVTIGVNAGASAKHATAIGSATTAKTGYSTALGFQSQAGDPAVINFNGEYATAIGGKAKALHAYTTALGAETNASGAYATAVGNAAKATKESTTAVGDRAKATNEFATALGHVALASGKNSTALGTRNEALGEEATAIGYHSHANGSQQLAIGAHAGRNLDGSFTQSTHGISIGSLAGADNATAKSNDDSVLIGTESGRYAQGGNRNTSIGKSAGQYLKGDDNIAMGTNAGSGTDAEKLEVSNTTSIGNAAKALTDDSISIGRDSKAGKVDKFDGKKSIAIGYSSEAMGSNAIALGSNAATNNGHDSIAMGTYAKTNGEKTISIGAYNTAEGAQSIVIAGNYDASTGSNRSTTTAAAKRAIVVGPESHATAEDAVAIGNKNTVASARTYAIGNNINAAAGTNDSLAFGTKAGVGGANAIALGNTAKATQDNSIAQGTESATYGKNSVSIGYKAISGLTAPTATQTNAFSVSIGNETEALDASTIAIGDKAKAKGGVDALAVGTQANAMTYKALAIGAYSQATGRQSTVIGNDIQGQPSIASGTRSQIIGVQSNVSGDNSVSIGDTNTIASARTYAMGNNINIDNTNAVDSLAFGTSANVKGQDQISIGHNAGADAVATAKNAYGIALGLNAGRYQQGGEDNYAIGQNAGQYVNGTHSVALGLNAGSHIEGDGNFAAADGAGNYIKGRNNIAIGNNAGSGAAGAIVEADRTISLGTRTQARGDNAVAIGTDSKALAVDATAVGQAAQASAEKTVAVGQGAKATERFTVAMGHNATASNANSVALGTNSATADVHTGDYTLNTSYTAAGLPNAANGTVSVGSAGKERQIQNVAAGVISATSTDAINGSQLYATNNYMNNFAGDVKTKLGGNAALGNDGHLTMTNIGGTGKDNVNDAIAAANTKVAAGDNITVTPTTNADGSKTYTVKTTKDLVVNSVQAGDTTVNTDGVTIAGGPSVKKDGINAGNKNITGVADGNVAAGSTDAVNGSQLHTTNAKLERVRDSLKDVMGGNATVTPLGDVTTSDIGGTGKDTVHDAIKAVNDKAKTAVQEIESANPDALSVKKDGTKVTLTPNVIAGDLVNPTTGAVNTPAAGDAGKLVTAGTVANALANTHFVVDTAKTDGELDAASKHDQKIKSGNKVTLQAGKNLKAKQTNAADGATVEFSLKDSISLTQVTAGTGANQVVLGNNGVQVGGNTLNSDGLTIAGGPSVKKDGINAGNKKITGVANGNVAAGSTDAVNGAQLHNVASSVANVLGGNAAVDGNGNVTSSDIGGTGANTVDDAIKAVNATAAKHTTVVEGKNVKVTKGKNAAGGDEYTVATKDDLDVTSVTAGNTTVNTNGLTITGGPSVTRGGIDAGNRVISGVKAGDVSATSQEAVNGSQLHATNTKLDGVKAKADTAVQDVKSGDENALTAVKDPNTNIVTVTPKLSGDLVDANGNITAPTTPADKGKLVTAGTVADALANTHFVVDTKATDGELDAASQADQKIKAGNKVTLQAGKNLKAKQTNGANGAQVEFSLKDSISLTQVTAGEGDNQVVLGNDGVKVGGNTYINKDGLNANNKPISNVADGVKPTDAVNKGQLDAVKGVADSAVKSVKAADGEENLVVDNADPKNPKLSLKKDLTVDSVKAGDSTLNTDGLTIAGGPSVKKDGINAGDKTITNVAPGAVTPTSKDAVNGSQLYNVANNVKDLIGPDATIDPATGKVTVADPAKGIGETGKGNIGDAIKHVNDAAKAAADTAKKHTTVEQGDNIVVEESLNADGGKHYKVSTAKDLNVDSVKAGDTTVNNDGVTIAGGPSVTKGGINAGGNTITNVADGVNPNDAVNKGQLDKVAGVADSAVKSVDVANGEQNLVVDNTDPKNPKLSLKKDLTVDSVKAGDTTVNNDGLTIAGGPSVKKDGIDAGDKKITNVAAGDVAENSKDAVNGGQLYDVAKNVADLVGPDAKIDPATGKVTVADPAKGIGETGKGNIGDAIKHVNDLAKNAADTAKKHTTVEQGDNIVVEESTNAEGGKHYKVSTAKNLNVDSVKAGDTTVNNDGVTIAGGPSVTKGGINAGGNTITNVADGVNPNDAVNKGQLDKVAGVADSAVKSVKAADGEQNLVVDNSDPKNPKLSLKKDLTVDSVKAGDTTVNNDGLTIAGGPSVKKDGIDAGDKKITNVAAGDVAENSKDAVNGGQLHNVAKGVADVLGGDAAVDGNGKVTMTNIGETGKGNVNDAIKHVNDLAKNAADTAKKHTTVEQGDNIVVEESTNADGGKHYKVSTAKNLNVDSVKAGDTTVNNDGVTIAGGPSVTKGGINAGGNTITNVADGVNPDDAVNKGQLDKVDTKVSNVAQNVVNVLGGDAAVNGNGDITMSNIGETGKGNINDAIKSVNDLAKKAAAEKTSVKAKEGRSNVTVTEGVNAAGGHEYTVDVERSVTNAGSDYVTVTNNHDADTNTTTYTVDVSAKTKASLAKADSAVQGLTSKDGNLNFTKGPNGNVEVSFNDNLNVKNVTTDRVQVANGPSMSKDGINAAGKAISNVANGNVAADSKDAVNGGQLHETAKSVADVIGGGATVKDGKVVAGQNGIGNTGQNTVHGAIAAINQNTANNFNQIRGDLRKMDRDLRGGIAGALATAGLPQAFRPGKSMVAAAASTYRGQSGLAIGVSRISDNGKVILKVTGNTNSRGDFGGTIGAGYQW